MLKNKRLESRRKKISKDVELFVERSFDIVDRIHFILQKQGKEQKDLAKALGKTESEISKWMTGTHNFTMKTLTKIEAVLGEPILQTVKQDNAEVKQKKIEVTESVFSMPSSEKRTSLPMQFHTLFTGECEPRYYA
ncbi:helix-turn-helix domain-containing protein [Saccharicrinis fermentans]|uniref:Helix-turn-helix protein n=1 Tax=Saccharicrinis fermentans DSM 9555 = JCM 21142 TaxID=869213 RepID=W7YMH3_9BACT|nr:helix-turn-helix transcriptional regulator [Saccharicrinis fermentans]GAF05871.1 helix-turn-helix protein [Saccharicrinis fermentans DSM 9555 = JCM 21142]